MLEKYGSYWTQSRVEFTPWHEQRWDRSDTVLGSAWHAERMALAAGDPERRAAVLSEAHANTPTTAHLDARRAGSAVLAG